MLDRQKVETILKRRFPVATLQQVAAAANAIMGLDDEWEEVEQGEAAAPAESEPAQGFRLLRRRCNRVTPASFR